ncbi:MAG: hypothetical protein J6M64_10790 [Oscillospiraceae bacterium]|nr:hypothetical protein [Oscillospiraceae bacterium]
MKRRKNNDPKNPRSDLFGTRAIDRTGMRYGRLTAIEPTTDRQGGSIVWRCRCDCGNEVKVRGNSLSTGQCWCCGRCLSEKNNDP